MNDRSRVRPIALCRCHGHLSRSKLVDWKICHNFDLFVNGSLCQYESVGGGGPSFYISFNVEVAIFTIPFVLLTSTETRGRIMPARQS